MTGAARGLGYAIASRLRLPGANVAAWDLPGGGLVDAVASLREVVAVSDSRKAGGEAAGIEANIANAYSVAEAMDATLRAFPQVDILINNAGISGPNHTLWEYPPDDWRRVIDVNLLGSFLVTRSAVPGMIERFSQELWHARLEQKPIEPLTARAPDLTIEDAYRISLAVLDRRLAEGETVVGKKIGLTSKAVQETLKVDEPDFGFLTDVMIHHSGDEVEIAGNLIRPRAEGEIAFRLSRDLAGPGVTADEVLAATEGVAACFEIVDSRIRDWRIKIQDTVADNASCGVIVLGDRWVAPDTVDLPACEMVVKSNGIEVATGLGAAAPGSPANAVAWLANALAEHDTTLMAGEIILSGSLVPLQPVQAGDRLVVEVTGIGRAEVRFA